MASSTNAVDQSPLWWAAASLASRAHRHQQRKDGRTPYVAHPVRVALTIACVFGESDPTVIAAALLHDVIEDTTVDRDEVVETAGEDVAKLVACLTKDARLAEPERQSAYERQLAEGPWQARLIKLADLYDNLLDGWSKESAGRTRAHAQTMLALTAGDERLVRARSVLQALLDRREEDASA